MKGTPLPWIELLRQHWAEIYQIEVAVRPGPRGLLVAVPYGTLVLADLLDEKAADGDDDDDAIVTVDDDDKAGDDDADDDATDDDGDGDDDGTDDDDDDEAETFTREGPEGAADVATNMYKRCGEHLRQAKLKHAYFEIACFDDKMKKLGSTTIGGHIRADGAIEIEDWTKETDRERAFKREDWMWEQFQTCVRMNLTCQQENANFMSSVTELVQGAMRTQGELAEKKLEHEEAKIDGEVRKTRAREAGKSWGETLKTISNPLEIFAAGYHANATRRTSSRPPHADAFIEAARTLLDALDGEAMSYLLEIMGPEPSMEILRVLRMSLDDDQDRVALAHAWKAVSDGLRSKIPQIVAGLPEDLAKRLATAAEQFQLMAEQIRNA